MSAASLRRWAMSSDSVSRSLRRPDLYSWPTSSLWRLSFTWLTRKCITAFGTLRQTTGVGGGTTKQMGENKDARWPRRLCRCPDGGGGLASDPPGGHASAQVPLRCKLRAKKALYLSKLSSWGGLLLPGNGKRNTLSGLKGRIK